VLSNWSDGRPDIALRNQMEHERHEREAREQSERTRLKRAATKHAMGFWNAALAGWRTILYPSVGTAHPEPLLKLPVDLFKFALKAPSTRLQQRFDALNDLPELRFLPRRELPKV
jgi:hypothetical protein